MGRTMSTKNKGRPPGMDATPKTVDNQNHTESDPLIGWFNLAKPVRNRLQKRTSCTWQKVSGK